MSKLIVDIPIQKIEAIEIHLGKFKDSLSQVAAKAKAKRPKCKVYIINGGMWNRSDGTACPHLKVDGKQVSKDPIPYWYAYGFGWNTGPDLVFESSHIAMPEFKNFISCTCLIGPWGPVKEPGYDKKGQGGTHGRSGIGLKPGYLRLMASQEYTGDARTPEGLRDDMAADGCTRFIMLDGGGSAQAWFEGATIPGDGRKCHNYIVVYVKNEENNTDSDKEDKPVSKKTVCLDPGHGPGTVNGSPDGAYKEREFAWDMYERISKLLEAHGVHTIVTRTEDTKPSLTERANVANRAGCSCFVSLHTNAEGGTGWGTANGLEVITSSGPMTAQRNVLATDLINAFHAAGVSLRPSPIIHNIDLTVLVKTSAPAVLIEYGFHTHMGDTALLKSSAYRDRLAEATAKGVCKWLGVEWEQKEPETPKHYKAVKNRFGFADSTMEYLMGYEYADALLERLATTK